MALQSVVQNIQFLSQDVVLPPDISPSAQPQPFLPLLAPSPLTHVTNNSMPMLLGRCSLNFSTAQDIITTTATDCWTSFAPYLANVVCCPQFDSMLVNFIGQFNKYSGVLALNSTQSIHCLSDVQKVLVSQGANDPRHICSIHPANLTEGSCLILFVDEFESIVDSSRLLTACRKIDPVNECCDQVCQNAINDAARKVALNYMSNSDRNHSSPRQTTRIHDSKNIVLPWLACKLDPSAANGVFRGLSNCNLNNESGFLLPSLPSDAEFDKTIGIGFICDLNGNVAVPWPSTSNQLPSSSNRTTKLPSLPIATSSQNGLYINNLVLLHLFTSLLLLKRLL